MARIPTYTAEGGLPAGGTGPQASPAAYAAPARALGNLGETIAQTGATLGRVGMGVAEMMEKRQEQDDAFWATKQSETLHREFYDYLQANKDSENLNADFLNFSNDKIKEAAKSAPSPKAGKILETKIGNNVTALYKSASAISFLTKESNRIEESKAAAQNIGTMIQSVPDLFRPDVVQTSKTLVQQRLDAIDSLSYGNESKRKIKSAFLVETILSSAAASPEFAMSLTENQVFDEAKRIQLRKEIESLQKTNNDLAIFNFEQEEKERIKRMLANGVVEKQPSDDQYKLHYPKTWQVEKAKASVQYEFATTVINEWNKIKSTSAQNQSQYLEQNKDKYKIDVYDSLKKLSYESGRMQSGKTTVDWMMQNNKEVSSAYELANSTSNPVERAKKLTAAHALSLQYQQEAPLVITDPEQRKKYLGRLPGQTHLLSSKKAEEMANAINAMPPERLARYITNELAVDFPDDKQRSIAWADLVSIPQNGIIPDIQFAMMMPQMADRANYLGIIQRAKTIDALTPDAEKKFIDALRNNSTWQSFHKNIDPTFSPQRAEIVPFFNSVISFSKRLSQLEKHTPESATEKAVEMVLKKSWGFTDPINGQHLAIQRMRDDFGYKPIRTDEEVRDIGIKLKLAVSQIPVQFVQTVNEDKSFVFPNAELIKDNENEKLMYIQRMIRSQSVWVMNADGQGAQLWLKGDGNQTFPLRDKSGKVFEVDFDKVGQLPTKEFGRMRIGGIATLSSYEYPIEYPLLISKDEEKGSWLFPQLKTNVPPVGKHWINLSP